MSLKPCRECKKEISTEATVCPNCGCKKPVARGLGLRGVIGLVAVAGIAYTCTTRVEETAKVERVEAETKAVAAATPPAWEYSTTTDKLDGSVAKLASLRSANTLSFEFPYNKADNRGRLLIRQGKKSGLNVMLLVDHGQFLCSSYDCRVRVRFDDYPPETWTGSGPTDHSSKTIFFNNEAAFLTKLRKAKRVKIEPSFYQVSGVVLDFKVDSLVWP
jgi:hypothetical protein